MRMDFREFVNEIIDRIPDYLMQYDIESIESNKVLKNNDVELTGLVIKVKE